MHAGKVIKILRKHAKMTQDQSSDAMDMHESSVQKYESGAAHNLKMKTIWNLYALFDVPSWVFIFPELLKSVDFTLALNVQGVKKSTGICQIFN